MAMAPTSASRAAAALPRRAFQWDLARQPERLDWLEAQLPRYAAWGYQELYLHLEDAVEYPSLPGVARPGAYTRRQMARLVEAASRAGIGVVPIVNLLGHTQYLLKDPGLRDLNELRGPDGAALAQGQICPLHPRTLEVAGKLLGDMAPFCTAGKVHVGLDESFHLGRHPLSRAEISRVGLAGHFAAHVRRLKGLTDGLGLQLGLWADMLALLPAAIPLLPAGIAAYDWYYYPFGRRPRLELRNFSEYDLAGRLQARGIEYWGCPMNGPFRHEALPTFGERLDNITAWWRRCLGTGAAGMLVTSWEGNRIAAEMAEAVDAAAAGLWLEGERGARRLLMGGCRRLFGRKGAGASRVLLRADRHLFCGYPRWRINDRWDTCASDGSLAPWRAEARACDRLARTRRLPAAVRASLRFRSYLAARDLFVRSAGQGVWRLRVAAAAGRLDRVRQLGSELDRAAVRFGGRLGPGRSAALDMWRRTRDPRATGPNERILDRDAIRLAAWRRWLRRCGGGGSARTASAVAGAWQLLFTLENFAPAMQKVLVERKDARGTWREVDAVFTLEFRAAAARPRANRVHRISVPLEGPVSSGGPPWLRLSVRGIGQVRVGEVRVTDGVRSFAVTRGRRSRAVIGRRAPQRGYPDLDWTKTRGSWVLKLGPCGA
jgi:hypothetical protein